MNLMCIKERFCLIFLVVFFVLPETSFSQNNSFAEQRKQMVIQQIQSRGISDKVVLDAFLKVPRHKFVLPEYIKFAYMDSPLPIAEGQTISQPYIVAFMTEALELQPTDKVLEVGTGSGYQAAILAQVCDSVFTIEIFNTLGKRALQVFNDLGYKNIFCKIGDGYQGWRAHAPYDAIIVTCSPTHVPQALKDQLEEGGRMIIPVGEEQVQQLVLLHKKNGKIREKKVLPVRFVPMINTENRKY
jgi:protein-L-isoaspartate(D-aspartate) O-methyltransferase